MDRQTDGRTDGRIYDWRPVKNGDRTIGQYISTVYRKPRGVKFYSSCSSEVTWKIKQLELEVEGHVSKFPIAGDANVPVVRAVTVQ